MSIPTFPLSPLTTKPRTWKANMENLAPANQANPWVFLHLALRRFLQVQLSLDDRLYPDHVISLLLLLLLLLLCYTVQLKAYRTRCNEKQENGDIET